MRMGFLRVFRDEAGGKIFLLIEPQPGQAGFVAGEQDAAERRIVMVGVLHGIALLVCLF